MNTFFETSFYFRLKSERASGNLGDAQWEAFCRHGKLSLEKQIAQFWKALNSLSTDSSVRFQNQLLASRNEQTKRDHYF